MRITTKMAREMVEVLEELREELFQKRKVSYPFIKGKGELIR